MTIGGRCPFPGTYPSKSINFSTAEEEQEAEEKADSSQDEGAKEEEEDDEGFTETPDSPVAALMSVNTKHTILTKEEKVGEEDSPAMQDVLMTSHHLHLPGFDKVEALSLLLLKLVDSEQHPVPAELRDSIAKAACELAEHNRSARNFVKRYKSKWGYTLWQVSWCRVPSSQQWS